jgi:hypothetical protein
MNMTERLDGRRTAQRIPVWALVAALAAVLGVAPSPARGQSGRGPQEGAEGKVDYNTARREIAGLEAAINTVIGSTFTGPFALVYKPKGVYLQGYGVMFDFLVNIHRAVLNTPFGEFRDPQKEITVEQKKRRIEELKEKLVRLLLERGDTLRQLRRDESVTIVAFVEDRNFPGDDTQNKTIVLRAFKRDLDELARKENASKELTRRMEIVEY